VTYGRRADLGRSDRRLTHPPGGIGAFFLIRRERAKFRQEELAAHANVIQADAQAEVLLSGEARALYTAARADADDARDGEREAWAEAAKYRRINVQLWVALDAWDRHGRRQDALIVDLGGVPLVRPADLTPRVLDD
jgi:hypothetical protein